VSKASSSERASSSRVDQSMTDEERCAVIDWHKEQVINLTAGLDPPDPTPGKKPGGSA